MVGSFNFFLVFLNKSFHACCLLLLQVLFHHWSGHVALFQCLLVILLKISLTATRLLLSARLWCWELFSPCFPSLICAPCLHLGPKSWSVMLSLFSCCATWLYAAAIEDHPLIHLLACFYVPCIFRDVIRLLICVRKKFVLRHNSDIFGFPHKTNSSDIQLCGLYLFYRGVFCSPCVLGVQHPCLLSKQTALLQAPFLTLQVCLFFACSFKHTLDFLDMGCIYKVYRMVTAIDWNL